MVDRGGTVGEPPNQVDEVKTELGQAYSGNTETEHVYRLETVDLENNPLERGPTGKWRLKAPPRECAYCASGFRAQFLPINPQRNLETLLQRTRETRNHQIATATQLEAAKDMKYWFARVYSLVTEYEIEACVVEKRFRYPHLILMLVQAFDDTYMKNLDARRAGQRTEPNWREAFDSAESRQWDSVLSGAAIKNALLPSMQAHIRFDLPRAIAFVVNDYRRFVPEFTPDDLKPDFDAMKEVFEKAQRDLRPEIVFRGAWALVGGLNADKRLFPHVFPIMSERQVTWQKAALIARIMREAPGMSVQDVQAALEASLPTGLLGVGVASRSFDIGGIISSEKIFSQTVRDYDWMHQESEPARLDWRTQHRGQRPIDDR